MPIEMPEIATTAAVAEYLKLSSKTVSNYAACRRFVPGIYLGKNKFNLSALKKSIETPPYQYLIQVRDSEYCYDK